MKINKKEKIDIKKWPISENLKKKKQASQSDVCPQLRATVIARGETQTSQGPWMPRSGCQLESDRDYSVILQAPEGGLSRPGPAGRHLC